MKFFFYSIMIVMLGIWVEVGTAQTTITETEMPDANLRAAVLARLKALSIVASTATTFTDTDMADSRFKVFSGFKKGISDMTGLKYATSLTELNLNENSISTIRTDLPTSLKKLHLRNNSISTIPDLSSLTVLEWLYLGNDSDSVNNNSISTIPTNLPTNLKDLRINDNSISTIPNLSSRLTSLTNLNLSNNSISTIPTANLPTSLKDLDLGGNSISTIPDLSGLTSLIALRLYDNSISDISEVSKLNLINLELQDNSISDISALNGKTRLQTLNLGNNNISDMSTVSSLTSLTHLELYNNKISDISAVAGLTSLGVLDLGGNSISDISALANLTSLTTLYISRNKISDISVLASLTNLLFLSLRNNEITTTDALLTLTGLDSLWLGDNRITDVNEFQKLSSLTNLYFLSLDSSYTNQLSILDDPEALRAFLYVPPPPSVETKPETKQTPTKRKIILKPLECPLGWTRGSVFGNTKKALIYELTVKADSTNGTSIYQLKSIAIYVHPDEGLETLDGWTLKIGTLYNQFGKEFKLTSENSVIDEHDFAHIENPEETPIPMGTLSYIGQSLPSFDYRLYDATGGRVDFGISCYKKGGLTWRLWNTKDPRLLRVLPVRKGEEALSVQMNNLNWNNTPFFRSEWTAAIMPDLPAAPAAPSLVKKPVVGTWADLKNNNTESSDSPTHRYRSEFPSRFLLITN